MADQTFRSTDKSGAPSTPGSAPYGFEKAASAAKGVTEQANGVADQVKSVADQALAASRDLKDKAAGLAGSSAEAIKDRASDAMDAAKDMASQATDKLKQTVDDQKNRGADYVGNLADTMRRAAREFDHDLPIAGAYIRKAASQIEGVSDQIKTGNFSDLVSGAQAFARRQPTAFLGLAVLAGFGAVRFLKSSANASDAASEPAHSAGAGFTPNHQANRSYSDNRGYRDDFTK
jgi:gas vesicle protein